MELRCDEGAERMELRNEWYVVIAFYLTRFLVLFINEKVQLKIVFSTKKNY